eukprot:COSAG01_NODE_41888_length_446_cov_0.368876_1_plen_133_part_01
MRPIVLYGKTHPRRLNSFLWHGSGRFTVGARGGQQARPEPSSLEPLPLAPISMLWFDLRAIRRLRSAIVDAWGGVDFVFRTIERPFQHRNWAFSCKRTQHPYRWRLSKFENCDDVITRITLIDGMTSRSCATL